MFLKCLPMLKSAKKIAVFTHINPDGDAIGSSTAFKLAMEQLGKKVDLYCDSIIHSNYYFLNTQANYVEHSETNYDLAVIVDCPDVLRIGKYVSMYKSIPNKLVIDHHLKSNIEADCVVVDENAGSAGIIVYRLLKELNIEFNKEIATCIYTAIATDTGCFMHNNTTREAHLVTAELMKYGFDLEKVNYYMFNRKTKSQIHLLQRALNRLQFHIDNKVVIAIIREKDFLETNTTYDDTIGILNVIRGIDGVDVSILLTETKKDCYKTSFRSYIASVSNIAENFKGGGHKHAAGCKFYGNIENIVNKLLEACKKEFGV